MCFWDFKLKPHISLKHKGGYIYIYCIVLKKNSLCHQDDLGGIRPLWGSCGKVLCGSDGRGLVGKSHAEVLWQGPEQNSKRPGLYCASYAGLMRDLMRVLCRALQLAMPRISPRKWHASINASTSYAEALRHQDHVGEGPKLCPTRLPQDPA